MKIGALFFVRFVMTEVKTRTKRRKQKLPVQSAKNWKEVRHWIDGLQREWAERNGKSDAVRNNK